MLLRGVSEARGAEIERATSRLRRVLEKAYPKILLMRDSSFDIY
jgi:hypothetical protein